MGCKVGCKVGERVKDNWSILAERFNGEAIRNMNLDRLKGLGRSFGFRHSEFEHSGEVSTSGRQM